MFIRSSQACSTLLPLIEDAKQIQEQLKQNLQNNAAAGVGAGDISLVRQGSSLVRFLPGTLLTEYSKAAAKYLVTPLYFIPEFSVPIVSHNNAGHVMIRFLL